MGTRTGPCWLCRKRLSRTAILSGLFHELAGRLHQVARFDHLGLHLYEAESDTVRLHVLEPSELAMLSSGMSFPIGKSPAGLVWQTQQPLIISNAAEETRWPRFLEQVRPCGCQSCCQLPLTRARRRLGTISFVSKQPAAHEAADLSFLQLVANQVALAVENALAFQEIEALKDKLSHEKVKDVRPQLEAEDHGKFVAIDIESGEYAIDADELKACRKVRKGIPDAQIWMVRVGYRTVHRIGSRQERREVP